MISGRALNFALAMAFAARLRSGSHGSGVSACAMRAAFPASIRLTSGTSAVGTMATARLCCEAVRRTSAITASRASQFAAAVQPLSMKRTIGPLPGIGGGLPSSGSASATMTLAAATSRSSSSHQGVCAGVSSSPVNPKSRRSGGNTTRRGKGGVTRKSHQIAGSTRSAARIQGAPKLNPERTSIISSVPIPKFALRAAHVGIERGQRRLRRTVGAMRDATPAQAPRQRAQRLGMRLEARAIGAGDGLGAAYDFALLGQRVFEARSSGEGKVLFGGIDDMNENARHRRTRQTPERDLDIVERREKIAQPDELRVLGDRCVRR